MEENQIQTALDSVQEQISEPTNVDNSEDVSKEEVVTSAESDTQKAGESLENNKDPVEELILGKFKTVLQEAAVTNVNLGQIIKLISENSTTKAEKQEIIERFGKEAKTVEQSKSLYESISRELKKNNQADAVESLLAANGYEDIKSHLDGAGIRRVVEATLNT